jgi:amino-acid N-acetyltransferase
MKKVENLVIRSAVKQDCSAMKKIIDEHKKAEVLLPKSIGDLLMALPFYLVAEVDNTIVGVCGFKIWPADGVEIISSAVTSSYHDHGIGKKLNNRCIENAKALGFKEFFLMTKRVEFYASLGFKEVPKMQLSSKVFTDCINCSKNRTINPEGRVIDCDEIAMWRSY